MGGAKQGTVGGHLIRLQLDRKRDRFDFQDPRRHDRVADNAAQNDITESESLIVRAIYEVFSAG